MNRIKKIEKITMSPPPSLPVIEPDESEGKEHGRMGQHRLQTGLKTLSVIKKHQKFGQKKRTGGIDDQKQAVAHQKSDDGD